MDDKNEGEIFMVRARRCKRCGGLLTSRQAVADGYGHTCKLKERGEYESRQQLPGQIAFPWAEEMEGSE